MRNSNRQSNFELLKIMAMLMIVSHHFIAKNYFNIDTAIAGVTASKLFLQFIGNQAFIGNNLFFMCSAWFLVNKDIGLDSFPKKQINHIWAMEKRMLFYSVAFWVFFRFLVGGDSEYRSIGKITFPDLHKSMVVPDQLCRVFAGTAFLPEGIRSIAENGTTKTYIYNDLCMVG